MKTRFALTEAQAEYCARIAKNFNGIQALAFHIKEHYSIKEHTSVISKAITRDVINRYDLNLFKHFTRFKSIKINENRKIKQLNIDTNEGQEEVLEESNNLIKKNAELAKQNIKLLEEIRILKKTVERHKEEEQRIIELFNDSKEKIKLKMEEWKKEIKKSLVNTILEI